MTAENKNEENLRFDREALFHDKTFSEKSRRSLYDYYSVAKSSHDYYRELLRKDISGKKTLEYGCGVGYYAFEAARLGAQSTGIDISPIAIEIARKTAVAAGVADKTSFQVMNAESLIFSDASFDMVYGSGILHHLDLKKSYKEIARVLKPEGCAVFIEPLGHNPLINWFRKKTPQYRTPDEHPLLMKDIALAEEYFSEIETDCFHLSCLGLIPLRKTIFFQSFLAVANKIDDVLLARNSPLRKFGWVVVMRMKKSGK